MEPFLKIKSHSLTLLCKLLLPGEQVQAAIPYGNMNITPGTVAPRRDRDYLILTDQRLLSVKGVWFDNGRGATDWQRAHVFDIDIETFLLGSTITIHLMPQPGGPAETEIKFPNCGKPDAEGFKKAFAQRSGAGYGAPSSFASQPPSPPANLPQLGIPRSDPSPQPPQPSRNPAPPEPQPICSRCNRPVKREYAFCPYCKTSLKRLCPLCGKPMQQDWAVCPFCGR